MSDTVRPGTQHLFDRAEPALEAGRYTLRREHDVRAPGGELLVEGGVDDLEIEIDGPRVALQPADILGVFPAPGETDALTERVPHIALRRRTLPWERSFGGDDSSPWMMLLLFTRDEVEIGRGTLGEMGKSYVGLPASTPVSWIEVGENILKKVVPHRTDEMPYLAHLRRVSRRDQEGAKDDDGDIAMVLGNRLPEPRAEGASTGVEHVACLVSLEGEESAPWWPGADDMETEELFPEPAAGGGVTFFRRLSDGRAVAAVRPDLLEGVGPVTFELIGPRHRLLLLHSWTFRSGESGDFQTRVSRLGFRAGPSNSLPASGGTEAMGASLPEQHGFARLDHRGRDGDPGQALYRGPLASAPGAPLAEDDVALSADALRRQVNATTEDIDSAAAFELGRLMALADPAFLRALIEWRRRRARGTAGARVVRQVAERTRLIDRLDERMFRPEELLWRHPADGLLGPLVQDLRGGGVFDPSPIDRFNSDPTGLAMLGPAIAGFDQDLIRSMKGEAGLAALNPALAQEGVGGLFETPVGAGTLVPEIFSMDVEQLGGVLGVLENILDEVEAADVLRFESGGN